jgi:uncharacterized membrane protein YeaQ/YmgE (transglycosylase-associated protein family)
MLVLSSVWFVLGILIGALANAARLRPASWDRHGRLLMPGVGALAALLGGWLGVLLLERNVATAMALWISVLGVTLPWLVTREWFRAKGIAQGK